MNCRQKNNNQNCYWEKTDRNYISGNYCCQTLRLTNTSDLASNINNTETANTENMSDENKKSKNEISQQNWWQGTTYGQKHFYSSFNESRDFTFKLTFRNIIKRRDMNKSKIKLQKYFTPESVCANNIGQKMWGNAVSEDHIRP